MSKLSGTWNAGFETAGTSIWKYTIYVLLSIVVIIAVSKFAFNSAPRKSKLVRTERVATRAYEHYTQKLNAISNKYANELEAKKELDQN